MLRDRQRRRRRLQVQCRIPEALRDFREGLDIDIAGCSHIRAIQIPHPDMMRPLLEV